MAQHLVFLDTEFSDLGPGGQLLSLALVFDEHNYLYLERKAFEVRDCSRFVVEVVLPLFDRYPQSTCDIGSFGDRIRAWVETLPGAAVVGFDSDRDWGYLTECLGGDFPRQLHVKGLNLWSWSATPGFEEGRIRWHEESGREQHHALYDALALRQGYLAARAGLRAGGGDD